MARETCPAMLKITFVASARFRKLRYQRVPVVVLQKSCAAVDPHPRREPSGDHPHSLSGRSPRNPHPSPEAVTAQGDGRFWYFRGAPLGLDAFPGMSGAGRGWRRREVPVTPGGTAIW